MNAYDPEAVINQLAAELANARVEAAKLRAVLAKLQEQDAPTE